MKKPSPRHAARGPESRRAQELLEAIAWHSQTWLKYGWPTPRLPVATRQILERAAKGVQTDPAELAAVIAAAEALNDKLSWGTLKRFPRIEDLN